MYDTFKWYFSKLPFESLDPLDQSLFLLGYVESKTFHTEKKILINELIELAKRYGDPWSPRIINAVFDKWISS
jgi:transcription termination factor NusB